MNRMNDKTLKATARDIDILGRLAEGISAGALQEILPDIEPSSAKKSLRTIVTVLRTEMGFTTSKTTPASRHFEDNDGPVDIKCNNLSLYTDGASRGNPGLAGAGYALYDDSGMELHAGCQFLGECTNNVAEYRALLLGLEAAHRKDCRNLSVSLDSELIVKQLNGEYRVKDAKLKPLFDKVKSSCALFSRCQFRHVPRNQNQRADQLANRAIDERNE